MGKVGILLIVCFAYTFAEECGENQFFQESNGLCRKTCANVDAIRCYNSIPGCYCKEDYAVVDETGECVLRENCPDEPKCGENEDLSDRFDPCPPSCRTREPPACLIAKFVTGCNCKPGYIRNDKTDKCVLEESCPTFDS